MMTGYFWLVLFFVWTWMMSFYSMEEMALISFNRLRLEHAIRSGDRRALWIKRLLDNPTLLFGTTLIGVNVALVMSSESLRRFFIECGLEPSYSVLIAAPYMIICGELVPMFAARIYPEHMARLGIPLLYVSSRLLSPFVWIFDKLFHALKTLLLPQSSPSDPLHLQRDELQNLVQEGAVAYFDTTTGQLESTVSKMFLLKDKEIASIMTPIDHYLWLQSTYLVGAARERFIEQKKELAMVVNRQKKIIGYIMAWDLLCASHTTAIGSIIRPVTYVSEKTPIVDSLLRMKKEQTERAFVVGAGGDISGFVVLNDILVQLGSEGPSSSLLHLEISVSGSTKLDEFCSSYRIVLPPTKAKTFRALIDERLGHKPVIDESVRFGSIEMVVKEVSLRGAKRILIRTVE